MFDLFGSKKIIGLDIGAQSIKIAEVEVKKKSVSLKSFAYVPTPQNSVSGGEIVNPQNISNSVRNLLTEFKARKAMNVGMSGNAVIVKKITVPKMDPKLLGDQLRWEAEQYIPFDINEISFDYHLISYQPNPESMDVLLVASQNTMIQQYLSIAQDSSAKVSMLDVSSFALANTFETNYGRARGQTFGLLDVGAGITNLVFVSDGDVVFARDLTFGGFNFTNEIHKELGISLQEAESMKMSACQGQEVPEEVHTVLQSTIEAFIEEIRNSVDFFMNGQNGLKPQRYFFCGGSVGIPGLIQQTSAAMGVAFEPLDPFLKVKGVGPKMNQGYLYQIRPFAAVAVGLALRQIGDRK